MAGSSSGWPRSTGRDEIEQCTAFLLMEGMRRIDEAAEQEGRPGVPANDIIFAY